MPIEQLIFTPYNPFSSFIIHYNKSWICKLIATRLRVPGFLKYTINSVSNAKLREATLPNNFIDHTIETVPSFWGLLLYD